MSILIKDVLLGGKEENIYVEGNLISQIGSKTDKKADTIINGKNKAIIPSFINTHTHSAMTLFRGYADDMRVRRWLETKIWPLESKLTEEDVYWGG